MTDHYAVVNPEDLQPVAQGPFICETCGKEFDSSNGLGGHRSSAHRTKVPCSDCGKLFSPGVGMSRHRHAAHGVSPKLPRKTCEVCGNSVVSKDLTRHMRSVHGEDPQPTAVKTRSKPAEWDVDDIFSAAVGLMYPKGVIPVEKLAVLIRWREATALMLTEVANV